MLYRWGEWYTEKNECLIYLFSTSIQCWRIHTKKTRYNKSQTINKRIYKNWGSKCRITKVTSVRILISWLNQSSRSLILGYLWLRASSPDRMLKGFLATLQQILWYFVLGDQFKVNLRFISLIFLSSLSLIVTSFAKAWLPLCFFL